MFVEEGFPFLVVLIRNLYRKWYRRYSRKTEKCPNQPHSPLLTNLKLTDKGKLPFQEVYGTYREHALFSQQTPVDQRIFGAQVKRVLGIETAQVRKGTKIPSYYIGLQYFAEFSWMVHFDRLLIPEQYLVSRTEYNTIISIPTRYFFNDHAVNKTVTLTHDGTWTLSIGGRTALDVSRLGLKKRYSASMLPALLRLVDDMRLCVGKKCSTVVTGVSRRSMLRCTTPFSRMLCQHLNQKHAIRCFV